MSDHAGMHFAGFKSMTRRRVVEAGHVLGGSRYLLRPLAAYRKRTLTYAVRIDEPFEVETLEGLHTGKAGDYLAVGAHGEMYPIDAAVFEETYEQATDVVLA